MRLPVIADVRHAADAPHDVHDVYDVCGIHFDAAGWQAYFRNLAERSPGYLRAFARSLALRSGADRAELDRAIDLHPYAAVDVLVAAGGLSVPDDEYVADLRRQGVRRQVLHGIPAQLADGTTVNERTAELAARHPGLLVPWAGLDLRDPVGALVELKRCVLDLGMRGVSLVHWWSDIDPLDPACHAIYALAAELSVPVWIHTGMNFAADRALATCTWREIDRIACAHPSLVVLAGHGGWPWVLEGIAVLQRHRNVYIDISTNRGRYIGEAGSGWEPLLFYGRGLVRSRVVFGSVTWTHGLPVAELAEEIAALPIADAAARAWLHDNADRALG